MLRKGLINVLLITGIITMTSTMTSFAGWEQSEAGWKYSDNNVYLVNGWYWLDGNGDGAAECYYMDATGVMAVNTSIEGYTVNESGAWTVDGVIQTKIINANGGTSQSTDNINGWDARVDLSNWNYTGGSIEDVLGEETANQLAEALDRIR